MTERCPRTNFDVRICICPDCRPDLGRIGCRDHGTSRLPSGEPRDTPPQVCGFALGRGDYCKGDDRFPHTHATLCPQFVALSLPSEESR